MFRRNDVKACHEFIEMLADVAECPAILSDFKCYKFVHDLYLGDAFSYIQKATLQYHSDKVKAEFDRVHDIMLKSGPLDTEMIVDIALLAMRRSAREYGRVLHW